MNTTFHKPDYKRVTYKEKVPARNPTKQEYQGENTGPYNYTKYAQCDFWLVEKTHQGMIKDCESKLEWARDSDHFPVWVKIQLNKKERKGTHPENTSEKILETKRTAMGRVQPTYMGNIGIPTYGRMGSNKTTQRTVRTRITIYTSPDLGGGAKKGRTSEVRTLLPKYTNSRYNKETLRPTTSRRQPREQMGTKENRTRPA